MNSIILLTIIRSIIVLIGIIISIKSFIMAKQYAGNKLTYVLFGIGFLVISFGVTIEGALYQFYHIDLLIVHSIEALITSLGLLLILLSIYQSKI